MKTILLFATVLATSVFLTTGCASSKGGCDGSCCKDPATCTKCCGDAAGCAKCCKKS